MPGASNVMMKVSLSARRAWIEITQLVPITTSDVVALRKESVNRNPEWRRGLICWRVALRKESVDRNPGAAYDCDI